MAHSIKQENGHNINSFININQTATEFVKYFYSSLSETPQQLIDDGCIYHHTIFKYNGEKYCQDGLIQLLDFLRQNTFNIFNMECIDSGSRRIDINILGQINAKNMFSQTFSLCHQKTHWIIKNSTLIIID